MKRFICVWLPNWPIDRLYTTSLNATVSDKPADPSRSPDQVPLGLIREAGGRLTLFAVNEAARSAGLSVGQSLADARAMVPDLISRAADPAGDSKALHRLALWCGRYSPWVAVDGTEGILLEVTGCAHLFGDEAAMIADMQAQLTRFGVDCTLAIADTLGAAWAHARFGVDRPLNDLPVAALRLPRDTVERLHRVGLATIGHLIDKPRAPLAARYGSDVLMRLDQALGRATEPLSPLRPVPEYYQRRGLEEPIRSLDLVENYLAVMAESLCAGLTDTGVGCRHMRLSLYRVDGITQEVAIRTARPLQDAEQAARLFHERLRDLREDMDAGFGYDTLILAALDVSPVQAVQTALAPEAGTGLPQHLLDRLGNRLGFDAIRQLAPHESHIPERADRMTPPSTIAPGDWSAHMTARGYGTGYIPRPPILLTPPEPVAALATVPDGPPVRFTWRRRVHLIARVEGPERIAPEWWGRSASRTEPTRDYYRVEDEDGGRFWLYREGLYGRAEGTPRWFLHGMFA